MVPHEAGHDARSEITIDVLSQIGRDGAAPAVDVMALDTALGVEKLLAAMGIAQHFSGQSTPYRERADGSDSKNPHG
jgi:hypothetical protein